MFEMLKQILRTGTVTDKRLQAEAPIRYHGKPLFVSDDCSGCGVCIEECPSGSLGFERTEAETLLVLDLSSCVFCGRCSQVCETGMIQDSGDYRLAVKHKADLLQTVRIPAAAADSAYFHGKGGSDRAKA